MCVAVTEILCCHAMCEKIVALAAVLLLCCMLFAVCRVQDGDVLVLNFSNGSIMKRANITHASEISCMEYIEEVCV
jgi:hypothetical protein